MAKKYLITSALPYVNNNLHIGHLIGCLLPSDVYARFCRAKGRDVLFVCGSDEHGTTSEIGARRENLPIEEYVDKYRASHEKSVKDFNLGVGYEKEGINYFINNCMCFCNIICGNSTCSILK